MELTGQPYGFKVAASDAPGPEQVGYAIYDDQQRVVRSFTLTASDDDHGVSVEGDGVPHAQTPTGIEVLTGSGPTTLIGTMNDGGMEPESGVYFLALWAAQRGGGWTWEVSGAVTVLAENVGHSTIAISSSDLSGDLVAHARPLYRWGGPAAYVGAAASFDVQHVFVGAADAPLVRSSPLTITRPNGNRATCLCVPRDVVGGAAWTSGRYTVQRSAVDVVLPGGTDVHVFGADIELPLA